MKEIPEKFKEMLRTLLGDEAEDLILALDHSPITSVRINRRKQVIIFPEEEKVPWCKSGFYLKERPEFILDPLLHAGAYYVQDASSMIYETVIEKIINLFIENSDKGEKVPLLKVLDLCAAPGGKTTAMINALPEGCHITANEYSSKRISALKENLDKWGYPYVTITNKDTFFYASQGPEFDIVAVDAPCSGEGMMRKEEVARTQWTPELVEQCASLQKQILQNAVECLKPGGYLIYSTCTFNRYENEDNAEYIAHELKLEPIDLNLNKIYDIPGGIDSNLPVCRFMPHKTKGEGLFLAVFRKTGEWEPSRINFKTSPSDNPRYPEIDVDKETALAYLRRESIKLPEESPKGMVTITYMGLPLGPAKNIGTRANNLYPKNRRILKR